MNNGNKVQDEARQNGEIREEKKEGRPMFYNFWGTKVTKLSYILIILVILAMVSMKMCDSPYIVPGDPNDIKIID